MIVVSFVTSFVLRGGDQIFANVFAYNVMQKKKSCKACLKENDWMDLAREASRLLLAIRRKIWS